jgi:cholesterol oxidase
MSPLVFGRNMLFRFFNIIYDWLRHPVKNLRVFFIDDFAKRTQILLFMRTIESRLRFSKGLFGMKSNLESGSAPTAFIPDAKKYAEQYSKIVNGKPVTLITETLFGMPTTAHILGGAVMGKAASEGVINKDNRVFGYENMYICDGSMISANPGVNPSLSIMAITERAMSKIPSKSL